MKLEASTHKDEFGSGVDRILSLCEDIVLIALFLSLSMFFTTTVYCHFTLPKLIALRAGALLLLMLWFIRLQKGQLRHIPRPVLCATAGLFVWWSFSTLFAVHKPTALHGVFETCNGLWNYAVYLILFFIVATLPFDETRIARLLRGFVIALLPVALYAACQHFQLDPLPWDLDRPASTVGNPVTLAALLGLGAPFALGFVATTPFMMRKTGWALVFTALTCAIYFTKSRGPWVGFGLATTGLIFLIFKSKGLNVKRLLGVLIVLGLVLTTFFVMNRERLGNTSGGQEDPSLYGRLMYYKAALTMIREHPITGVGFDNFRILYPKFRPPEENLTILGLDFLPTTVHNGYLQLALTNGIPGLLAYLTLVAAVLVSLIATCRRERQYERRITGAVFVASISGYLIQDLTGWPHLALTPCFWIVMALAVSFTIQNGPELKLTRLSLPIAEVATCSCVIVLGWLVLDAFNRLNADKLLYQCYTALNIGTDWPIIESKIAQALKTQRADSYCEDMAARIYMKRLSVTSDVESYYAGIRLIEQAHLHNPYDVYTLIHGLDMTMLAMKRGLIQVPSSFVEDSARKLPAMDKDNPSVYEAVAGLRFAEQKFDEAIPLIRHAQGLMPSQARYYLLEAMVYQRLQDPSRANAALKRVIHILERGAPPYTDEWVFAKCAIAINLIQAHDYAQAQKTIEDIIERFPKDADSHVMLGNLFLDLRRLDKARETFAALLRIDPSNTAAREGFERAGELEKQP